MIMLSWSNDMTPWECPPLYKGDSYCKESADDYLELIENEIIPKAEDFITNELHKEIEYFGVAGYSLGGLLALYSGYKTDIFKRMASVSGSMWYPNFAEYVKKNEISKKIDKIYFSLGNKEYLSNDYIDTLRISRRVLPQLKHHKLDNLIDYFNLVRRNGYKLTIHALSRFAP